MNAVGGKNSGGAWNARGTRKVGAAWNARKRRQEAENLFWVQPGRTFRMRYELPST